MSKRILAYALIIIILSSAVYGSNNYSFEIMQQSDLNTTVYVNGCGIEGRTILIIGGVHGDETAGIIAAEKLSNHTPKTGALIVIPRANSVSCGNSNRTEYYMDDLNRSFLGSESGSSTQRLAWEIVNIITSYKPDLIVDLHESRGKYSETSGYIGQSIILSENGSLEPVEIAFEIMDKLEFTVLSGAPEGSINREVSQALSIPVITIETSMDQELDSRVMQQLHIIEIVLNYYGMDD